MKRPRAHQIDGSAQSILLDQLPKSWVVNQHNSDYGKDFTVEIRAEDGELSGESFCVQLKGKQIVRVNRDQQTISFSLRTSHAKYYHDKVKDLPVFLVVIDVTKKICWWAFLQKALDETKGWRKKGSVSIRIPVSASLANTAKLTEAVRDAKRWLRLNDSRSIQEAVIAHKERLKHRNPRFDIDISFEDNQPVFNLSARETVPFRFKFKGNPDSITNRVCDFIDKGIPV